jgi:A/G-specific adenine glycosylase
MRDFSTLIQDWFRQKGRDLPWRRTKNPYLIWLSEIILQQTRVDQGMAYYEKFVEHYPTVLDLANASEDRILRDWQGLGYYSRARNLHHAAKTIRDEFNGKFPDNYNDVLSLKGVGEYTAAAVCSFAYELPHAVVDGNVYRLLSRFDNCNLPIDSTEGQKYFKQLAQELLDKKNPGNHNQAAMEMGALMCAPKNPDCENCPLSEDCLANRHETQLALPVKAKKTKVRDRYFHYMVLKNGKEVAIRKRKGKDIWEGLHEFLLVEVEKGQDPKLDHEAFSKAKLDGEFKHILSHQRIHAKFWLIQTEELPITADLFHVPIEKLDDYAMPQLLIRYLENSELFTAD